MPVSLARILLPPMGVLRRTLPGMSSVTVPIRAAFSSAGDFFYCIEDCFGGFRCADREHPSFTGAVERIEAEHIAGGFYRGIDGERCFIQFDGERHLFCELIECGGDSASGRVAQDPDRRSTGRCSTDRCRTVGQLHRHIGSHYRRLQGQRR